MRILLTGHPGWLSNTLLEKNYQNHDIYTLSNIELKKSKHFNVDIRNKKMLKQKLSDSEFDVLVHAAGLIHPSIKIKDFYDINFEGTKNLFELSSSLKINCFIFLSSNAVYGKKGNLELCSETSIETPINDYGKSKLLAEKYVYENISEFKRFILRPASFYGGNYPQKYEDYFNFIKKYFCILPFRDTYKNFTSLNLLSDTIYHIINNFDKIDSSILNVTDNGRISLEEYHHLISKHFKFKLRYFKLPNIFFDILSLFDNFFSKFGLYSKNIHLLSEANWNTNIDSSKVFKMLGNEYHLNKKNFFSKDF